MLIGWLLAKVAECSRGVRFVWLRVWFVSVFQTPHDRNHPALRGTPPREGVAERKLIPSSFPRRSVGTRTEWVRVLQHPPVFLDFCWSTSMRLSIVSCYQQRMCTTSTLLHHSCYEGVAECGFRHSCAGRNPVKPMLDSRWHGNDDRCATPSYEGCHHINITFLEIYYFSGILLWAALLQRSTRL